MVIQLRGFGIFPINFVYFVYVLLSLASWAQCCLDEDGASVAWFFIYKQPGAYSYAYLDSNSPAGSTLKISANSIDTTDSALGKTLAPLHTGSPTPSPSPSPASSGCCHYSDASCVAGQTCCSSKCNDPTTCSYTESGCAGRYGQVHGCVWTGSSCIVGSNNQSNASSKADNQSNGSLLAHLAYNDEVPNGATNSALAHAKGVLAYDGQSGQGYWLIHSLPKFPDLSSPKYYWSGSTKYGQSFLCLTLDSDGINTAAKLLITDQPNVYSYNIPPTLSSVLPDLASLSENPAQGGGNTRVAVLTPLNSGLSFTVFAKSAAWGRDLYEDLVEPDLGAPCYWETWRRTPQEPTDCTFNSSVTFDTMNIEYMQFGSDPPFRYTKDHSKVGLSTSATDGWVCVGDINRMTSQSKRGGGTACTQGSPTFYAALDKAVYEHDTCSQRRQGDTVNLSSSDDESTGVTSDKLLQSPDEPMWDTVNLSSSDDESTGVTSDKLLQSPDEPVWDTVNLSSSDDESTGVTSDKLLQSPDEPVWPSTHPGVRPPKCSCSVIAGNGYSQQGLGRNRQNRTVAACSDDYGWLKSTFLCDSMASPPGSVAKCLASVQQSSGTDCGCLRNVCSRPGHPVPSSAPASPQCSQQCHKRCWLDPRSTCSGYDDQQSACVFFCTDYCLNRRDCASLTATTKSADTLDKSHPPLVEPVSERWCHHLRGCERRYLDPVWNRDGEKSAWRLSDYSDCKLKCLFGSRGRDVVEG